MRRLLIFTLILSSVVFFWTACGQKPVPSFNLYVEIEGDGIVLPNKGTFPKGELITFVIQPKDGWCFSHWSGRDGQQVVNNNNKYQLLIDQDMILLAVFTKTSFEGKHNLRVDVEGEGSVYPKMGEFEHGSLIKFEISPDTGWSFSHWGGKNCQDVERNQGKWELLMNGDKDLIAVFLPTSYNGYTLEVMVVGNGHVDQRLISDKEEYPEGSIVRLTARPDAGWIFKGWNGDGAGSNENVEILMNKNKFVLALFEEIKENYYKLNLDISGKGTVSITPDKSNYSEGERVSLVAIASSNWQFKEWRGDASGANAETEIIMNEHKNIEAIFMEKQTGGTVEISGGIKLVHTWPHPYTVNKGENIGKIPVLNNLGIIRQIQPSPEYVKGQLIVSFRDNNSNVRLMGEINQLQALQKAGLTVLHNLADIDAYLVEAPMDEVSFQEEIKRLNEIEGVMFVEPNYILSALSTSNAKTRIPNDPLYNQQWHYNQIRLPHAWSVTTGSSSVRVAVLDTGVNHNHPDLKGRVDTNSGWNFVRNDSNAMDGHGHGTHCAGTIGANSDNAIGVAGIMWEGQIIPIKVLDDEGRGSMTAIADGILYAAGELAKKPISQKADILSMSLGSIIPIPTLQNACKKAEEAGCLIVVAAGNSNGPIAYPGRYSECITIGSTGYNYPGTPKRAPYSSYGKELDVMTPGGDTTVDSDGNGYPDGVLSTVKDGYEYYQGTSMATPHAAGVCGLMLANGIPSNQVRTVLHRTAMDLGGGDFSNEFGYGLVNVYWAVCDVKEIKILVGTRTGNRINAVAEGKVDLRAKTYTLSNIPTGEYQVFGWVDVQNTGTVDSGDYLFESNKMLFQNGQKLSIDMELKEIN